MKDLSYQDVEDLMEIHQAATTIGSLATSRIEARRRWKTPSLRGGVLASMRRIGDSSTSGGR